MTEAVQFDPAPSPVAVPLSNGRNIIAIASGKGGVGKTWFSITLAHALAQAGRRTLLFDGDLGLANVDVQLGITSDGELAHVVSGEARLDDVVTQYDGGAGRNGFDIIAGRSGSYSLANLPPAKLVALRGELQRFSRNYDWVVLDLGAGIERTVRHMAAQSRACLVLTTDEPTAITDAYAYIKLTALERLADGIRIVVNMASGQEEGERSYATLLRACREFLKIEPPLAGIVRRDEQVKESIRRQASLLQRNPNADAARDVEAIARRIDRELRGR
ncbi:MAG TPA: MinD/ParA family protein [Stellaceae bacterium]|nr:MinD/ParA family protein [Stellaceae bacterium]